AAHTKTPNTAILPYGGSGGKQDETATLPQNVGRYLYPVRRWPEAENASDGSGRLGTTWRKPLAAFQLGESNHQAGRNGRSGANRWRSEMASGNRRRD